MSVYLFQPLNKKRLLHKIHEPEHLKMHLIRLLITWHNFMLGWAKHSRAVLESVSTSQVEVFLAFVDFCRYCILALKATGKKYVKLVR